MPHDLDQGQAHQDNDDTGNHRGRTPAKRFHTQNDDGDRQPADGKSDLGQCDRFRPVRRKPIHQWHHQGGKSTQAGTNCNQGEGEVKRNQAVDLAEHDEPNTEYQDPNSQDYPRPKPVNQPALEWAEDSTFDSGQGKGTGY